MRNLIIIFFLALTHLAVAQQQPDGHQPCMPPAITREIVRIDSLPVHHSFCLQLYKLDKSNRVVVASRVCDTSNGNTYFLLDNRQIGMQYDEYYDTTGKVIFEAISKNNQILECYNTFVYRDTIRFEYKEGYKLGVPLKISYEYDEYGNYSKKTTTTPTETTIITYTKNRDSYGNYIQETKTIPRLQKKD